MHPNFLRSFVCIGLRSALGIDHILVNFLGISYLLVDGGGIVHLADYDLEFGDAVIVNFAEIVNQLHNL